VLRQLLDKLPVPGGESFLASFDNSEDAAVVKLDASRAAVVTIDVITPLVDDPRAFGAIAAANALSDIYAMGGEGLLSLSFLATTPEVPPDVLEGILIGGAELAKASGAPIVGGHSVETKEVMFGLVAVGLAHPDKLFRNDALESGDQLVLTKPLGTGTLATAVKTDVLTPAAIEPAVAGMRQTHRAAVEPLHAHGVRAATDVTGFGLLGHAAEMALASGVRIVLEAEQVPAYPLAREMLDRGIVTRGNRRNGEYARSLGPVEGTIEPLFVDPQTSGGLFAAVAADRCGALIAALRDAGFTETVRVGEVRTGAGVHIT
jgi:selenide,water dikinase